MIHYTTDELSKKQQYKFLSGSILPRPIAWVTTFDENHQTINAAPFSFFNAAASDIPLVSLSILRKEGTQKDTARNILVTKEAVVHLVDDSVVEKMNQTSASLAPDESEILGADLETVPSNSVSVPGIKAAKLRMETVLHQYIPLEGLDGQVITDLFILKVTDFYFAEEIFDSQQEYILADKLSPIARLAGNSYAHIADLFSLERPE